MPLVPVTVALFRYFGSNTPTPTPSVTRSIGRAVISASNPRTRAALIERMGQMITHPGQASDGRLEKVAARLQRFHDCNTSMVVYLSKKQKPQIPATMCPIRQNDPETTAGASRPDDLNLVPDVRPPSSQPHPTIEILISRSGFR